MSHKYVDCPVGSYHYASPETPEERVWVERNDAARIEWVFGERSAEYSKAIKFALNDSRAGLTFTQLSVLLNAGLMRSDVEVEAFDAMERADGTTPRVRYLGGEIERL